MISFFWIWNSSTNLIKAQDGWLMEEILQKKLPPGQVGPQTSWDESFPFPWWSESRAHRNLLSNPYLTQWSVSVPSSSKNGNIQFWFVSDLQLQESEIMKHSFCYNCIRNAPLCGVYLRLSYFQLLTNKRIEEKSKEL